MGSITPLPPVEVVDGLAHDALPAFLAQLAALQGRASARFVAEITNPMTLSLAGRADRKSLAPEAEWHLPPLSTYWHRSHEKAFLRVGVSDERRFPSRQSDVRH